MTEDTQARIRSATELFRINWRLRHDRSPAWRRRYRHFARVAVGDLRYLTDRPRKGEAPTHYGQPELLRGRA